MTTRYSQLVDREFDVVVIGAGMFGACIAYAAVQRGLSVAVIDKGDFAAATSSNHLKVVHGGIRYLQHLDLVRLRESSWDRSNLLRIAPHLAYRIPIVFPTYGYGSRSKTLMRAGMFAYDMLTLDRNRGIHLSKNRIPNGSVLGKQELLEMFPGAQEKGLTGAAVFYDGQMYNPARLVLAFLQSAILKGAVATNYIKADRLLRDGTRIVGCGATDVPSGRQFEIKGRVVINAAGPWAHRLLDDGLGIKLSPVPSFSRDLSFVVKKSINSSHAIGCQTESADSDAILDRGGRHLFLVPWRGMTLVGVWHRLTAVNPDEIAVSREELQLYLDELNSIYNGLQLRLSDITRVNTGLTLFGSKDEQDPSGAHSFAKRSMVVDHSKNGLDGLVTVIGVRATVACSVAEETIRIVEKKLHKKVHRMSSTWKPIHGGVISDFDALVDDIRHQLPSDNESLATAIAHNYGSEYSELFACADDALLLTALNGTNVMAAEGIHAVRNEMAISLEDVVLRRTELGTAGDPGVGVIERIAEVVGRELGWDSIETAKQVRSVRKTIEQGGPWEMFEKSAELEMNT